MTTRKYLQLRDIEAYVIAFQLSNYVWKVVLSWDYFARKTVGDQLVRAIDSISANIAEGFGRYGKKDKVKFYRISMGSAKESLDWTEKSRIRKLLNEDEYKHIFGELSRLPQKINGLVKFTNDRLKA